MRKSVHEAGGIGGFTVRRRWVLMLWGASLMLVMANLTHGAAASDFAAPAFQQQWQAGEAIVPNFWGPLDTARDGQQETYREAPGGRRLVQYFDKGRMELTNGAVTNGLLATELVTGRVQVGDNAFEPRAAPAIPIAGDPTNIGPTYAAIDAAADTLLAPAPAQQGTVVSTAITPAGAIIHESEVSGDAPTRIGAYDDATSHNVMGAFMTYRATAGLATIGFAISEPFRTTVRVADVLRPVVVQIFERRVLTYTADNPDAFKVEMGNIGQHYYQWRYVLPAATSTSAPTSIPSTTPAPTRPASTAAPIAAPPLPPTVINVAGTVVPPPPGPTPTAGLPKATTPPSLLGPTPSVTSTPVGTVPPPPRGPTPTPP